jgi:hypothetical protein
MEEGVKPYIVKEATLPHSPGNPPASDARKPSTRRKTWMAGTEPRHDGTRLFPSNPNRYRGS